MKNIFKRLTSLLLVFAMLLSFAAVVGAEGKVARFSVDNVAAKAGETVYVPIRLTSMTSDYIVGANAAISVEEGAPISTAKISARITVDGNKITGTGSGAVTGTNTFGWQNVTDGFDVADKNPFLWIPVTIDASASAGTYSISIGAQDGKAVISTLSELVDENTSVDSVPHRADEIDFVDGSITVLPAGAELPTLIMTKTSFPRPTKAGGDGTQSYDLAQYVKLVGADGSVTNAENLSVTGEKVVNGNKLQLSYTDTGSTTVTVSAGGLSKQITLDITSGSPVLTSVEFANVFEESYTAPAPGEESLKTIDLNIQAYDQYGDKMAANTRAILKVNGKDPGENSPVYLSGNQICIRSDLANDVTCTVIPFAQGLEQQGGSRSFMVKSSLPKATKAILTLTTKDGTPLSGDGSTLEVPFGTQPDLEVAVAATVYSQYKDTDGNDVQLDPQPENITISATLENGETLPAGLIFDASTKVLTVSKGAADLNLPVKVKLSASVGDGKSLGEKLVTIQKADLEATSLGCRAENGYTDYIVTVDIDQTVPAVGEKLKWKVAPVYVLDQYGQPMIENGEEVTVPADAFELYYIGNNNAHTKIACAFVQNEDGTISADLTNAWVNGELLFGRGEHRIRANFGASLSLETGGRMFTMATSTPTRATITEVGEPGDIEVPVGSDMVERKFQIAVFDQYGAAMPNAEQYAEIVLEGYENAAQTGIEPEAENGLVTIRVDASAKKTITDTTGKKLTINVTNSTDNDGVTEVKTLESKELTIKRAAPVLSDVTFEVNGSEATKTADGNSSAVLPAPTASANVKISSVKDQYGASFINHYEVTTAQATGFTWSDAPFGWTVTLTSEAANQSGTLTVKAGDKTFTLTLKGITLTFQNSQKETPTLNDFMHDIDNLEYNGETFSQFQINHAIENPAVKALEPNGKEIEGHYLKLFYEDNNNGQRGDAILDTDKKVMDAGTYWVVSYFTSTDGKYNQVEVCAGRITVAKKQLTLGENTSGSKTISKEYDGKYDTYTWATGENWTDYVQLTSGVLGGDTVFLNENQTGVSVKFFVKDGLQPSKDVGEKTVKLEIPAAGALTGKDAGNYTISGADINGVLTGYRDGEITPKHLKVKITALDKPWDSTNSLSGLQATWSGCVDGEGLSVWASQNGLTFNDTDVGSWISDAPADLAKINWALDKLASEKYQHTILENYTVTREDVTFENFGQNGAKITKVKLTLKGVQSRTGTYGDADSTLLALDKDVEIVRPVTSTVDAYLTELLKDKVQLIPTGATKTGDYYNASETPYVLGAVLDGVKSENYTLYVAGNPTLTINPKPVTVALKDGVTITKTYDGTNDLPDGITADSFAVTGAVGTDVLTVDLSKMTYLSEDVGNNIPLSVDSGLLKATNGLVSNYEIDTETAFSGAITARGITVTPTAGRTFEYGSDQIAAALGSAYDVTGNLEGKNAAKLTGSMALTSTDAGTRTVTQGDLALASESAQNYTLTFTDNVTWEITPKTVGAVTASIKAEFGKSTDELLAQLREADVTIGTETVKLRDLGQTLTFQELTSGKYAQDEDQKQYPVPGTYTVTVENPTTVQRNNYQVTDATTYSLTVTVKKSQKALTVTLYTDRDCKNPYTDRSFSYNGEEQKVFAVYRFQLDDGKILRLPSVNMGGETNATNAGTYTVRIGSPCCQPGSAEWKINTRQIKAALKGDLSAPYGTELNDLLTVSADKLTVTATDGGTLPSGDKAPQWSGKLKVNGTKNAAGYYDVREFDVGVETLQETSGNYAVTYDKVIGKLSVTKNTATPFTTNPVEASVTRGAEATIQVPAGYRFTNDKDLFSFGTPKDANGVDAKILTKDAEIVLSQGSNGSLSVKVSIQDDANLVGKVYTLPLTLADSGNHGTFTVELKLTVTDKPQQTGFAAKDPSGNVEGSYSYSQASVLLHAENAKGNVTWTSEKETIAKVETNGKVTFERPGTVRIKAVSDETGGYAEATAYYTLTVTMGQITVTASSATMTANDPLPSFTATATGLNPMDSASDVFQTMTASVSTDGKTAGTFRVTPYAAFKTGGTAKHWDDYYTLTFIPGTLTVLPATSVIDTVLPLIIGGNGCANGYANCACESFYDLDAGRWYHEAIDWAYNLGLMNGTTKTTFGPNAAATRAQTWTMLARIAGQDTGRSSTWYEVGRTWAMGLGITDGANPMGTLTREQLAAMLYRYVGSPAVSGALRFADSASVSSWARDAMVWAVQNGILDGVGGNRLNPKGTTTRAQAAAIFMRFQKLMNR